MLCDFVASPVSCRACRVVSWVVSSDEYRQIAGGGRDRVGPGGWLVFADIAISRGHRDYPRTSRSSADNRDLPAVKEIASIRGHRDLPRTLRLSADIAAGDSSPYAFFYSFNSLFTRFTRYLRIFSSFHAGFPRSTRFLLVSHVLYWFHAFATRFTRSLLVSHILHSFHKWPTRSTSGQVVKRV